MENLRGRKLQHRKLVGLYAFLQVRLNKVHLCLRWDHQNFKMLVTEKRPPDKQKGTGSDKKNGNICSVPEPIK